ncbi:MAG: asparagine synthase (glutamine-hydrolyzing) [Sphingomonadales bacterium]|jgi:asparagine synthase (glutamine-hydrolysing)
MCGIAGAVGSNLDYVNSSIVKVMTDAIAHRGPDGEGTWTNSSGSVVLGHRRLSIIDVTAAGAQPMHYLDRYVMVFNGEIYNYLELKSVLKSKGYTFFSGTDSEVLMALYDDLGVDCLDQLDGMFAFVIWDKTKQQLFCARDRFGEKPFYYSSFKDSFLFCSEIKGLWAAGVDKKVDPIMLFNYRFLGHVYNPGSLGDTFYTNIKSLPPATYLIINMKGEVETVKKYWDIDHKYTDRFISFEDACARFKSLFDESVRRRLRSDVTLGSSLSGGLDSSSVVCTVERLKGNDVPQKTFSARFPGFKKDESRHIDEVLATTHARGYSCYPTEETFLQVVNDVIRFQDEPFGSLSIVVQYEVMALAKSENTIVLLDGQGADEYLCGYHGLLDSFFNELACNDPGQYVRQLRSFKQLHAKNEINTLRRRMLGIHLKRKLTNKQINTLLHFKALFANWNSPSAVRDLLYTHRNDVFQKTHQASSLNQILYDFTLMGGLQELLRYADRNSMAHSREVRLPFLYHKLVEFVFSLPSHFKVNDGFTKYILRKSMEDRLPESIAWRKDKIGYEPPKKNKLGGRPLNDALIHEFNLQ